MARAAEHEVVRAGASLIGSPELRKEDARLLRGDGAFADDFHPFRALHMAVGRCPFPRARIVDVDVAAARDLPGVADVLVGADVAARSQPLTVLRPVPGAPPLPYFAMAGDVALYEGQPVVTVVAESRHVAEDAIALVRIDYEPLPHVTDTIGALDADAPCLHPSVLDTNVLAENLGGDGDPDAAIERADLVLEERFRIGRVTPLPMEGRAIVADWSAGRGELSVRLSTQTPHLARTQIAECLGLRESAVDVVASDVGGGFGQKLGIFPEEVLASLHAIRTHQPVKWVEDRLEHFRTSTHGRESVHDVRIGVAADGTILGMEDVYYTDLGAYNSSFGSAQLTSITFPGPYRVRDVRTTRRVTITNKTPIGAYRGYGQPESNFVREVLLDRIARRLDIDPLDLRLRNMLGPDELPWTNPAGSIYDSGDYPRCLLLAAERIGYAAAREAGRAPRASDGRIVGVGLSSFVERTGYPSARFLAARGSQFGAHESVTLRANRSGGIDLYTGVSTFGQGSETAFAQVCAEFLGVRYDDVAVHAGDTSASPLNTGGFASRTLIAAAGAIEEAAVELRGKILRIAAHMLDVADPDSLTIINSRVCALDDPTIAVPFADVCVRAIIGQGLPEGEAPGLEATAYSDPRGAAFGFGTAAARVAVDPETGEFDVEQFVMVHDSGTPVNPRIIEGQVRGALAQGIGATMMEELLYDSQTGQLLNGSMLDYFAPTAADLPPIELLHTTVPSPVTTFGVRGVGEAGTVPPGAAIANAVCDALADHGVEIRELPITPERVWRAMHPMSAEGGRE
ncbi:MAG: xanthine dehydrogenase family protein molybdopterin-binding subunit [Gaiellales bacterium]